MNDTDALMQDLQAWGREEIRAGRGPAHAPAVLLRARLAREEARRRRAARLERAWAALAGAAGLLALVVWVQAGPGRQALAGLTSGAALAAVLPVLAALALAGVGLAWALD